MLWTSKPEQLKLFRICPATLQGLSCALHSKSNKCSSPILYIHQKFHKIFPLLYSTVQTTPSKETRFTTTSFADVHLCRMETKDNSAYPSQSHLVLSYHADFSYTGKTPLPLHNCINDHPFNSFSLSIALSHWHFKPKTRYPCNTVLTIAPTARFYCLWYYYYDMLYATTTCYN